MYDTAGLDSAPKVRIEMMAEALAGRVHTERITGGRLGRFLASTKWLVSGGPRRVGAVYVESPTANAMPTDLAFLALMRLLRRPVGVYFRDAYQLFRDIHPRTRRRQVLTDFLWRLTTPLLKRVASVRFVPTDGLAQALGLTNAILLPPGTDPKLPDLGIGEPDVVAAIAQVGPGSGLDTLVAAMTIVRERRPAARLIVAARSVDGPMAAGLPDWVQVAVGGRASLPDLLRPGRLCVLPLPINRYTNLAVAVRLLDLLGFGKPIVATDTSPTRAIIEASRAGTVTPDTAAGLAQGILPILEDADLAARLAVNARLYACSPESTWDARASTVLERLSVAETPAGAAAAPAAESAGVLRIAFLADPNSVHTRRWTGYFAGRGHKVTLIVGRDLVISPGLPAGIAIERYVPYSRERGRLVGALTAARSFRRVLNRLNPDVLHAHYLTGNGWLAWISRFHPYVVSVWGSDILITARESRRARLHTRVALRGADLVTGNSEHLVKAAVAAGAKAERTHYVNFGVDTERFCPGPDPIELRARLGLKGRRVIFSPRTIAPLYHHETVIAALAQLPQDVVVLMTRYLANATELEALESQAAELGVAERVIVVDAVTYGEMPDLYRLADVVVSLAASDGGPITVIEALATGRPVVATDLPAVREWAAELDPAALVPVADAAATASAIERLLSLSLAERDGLARGGRAAVEERAGERANMERMELLYRELAGRSRRRA
jgi:glycosyltransferase involved in cell wall biosynthesis